MFAANLGDLLAKVLLFENSNNLIFFEFGLFHRFLKVRLENQILTCMKKPATYPVFWLGSLAVEQSGTGNVPNAWGA